jgi:hypothetical protein
MHIPPRHKLEQAMFFYYMLHQRNMQHCHLTAFSGKPPLRSCGAQCAPFDRKPFSVDFGYASLRSFRLKTFFKRLWLPYPIESFSVYRKRVPSQRALRARFCGRKRVERRALRAARASV